MIHRQFAEAKRALGYINPDGSLREIKYTLCKSSKTYKMAKSAVNCFINSDSFFRAIVIIQRNETGFNLDYFGQPYEGKAIKEARAYKKFCELLLIHNIQNIQPNGILYTDKLYRCRGDAFCQLITESFGTPNEGYSVGNNKPIFKHIAEVDTSIESYHLGQIGDILQGVILNEIAGSTNKWKVKIRNYVKGQLNLPSLSADYWTQLPKWYLNQKFSKYQIWYWRPVN